MLYCIVMRLFILLFRFICMYFSSVHQFLYSVILYRDKDVHILLFRFFIYVLFQFDFPAVVALTGKAFDTFSSSRFMSDFHTQGFILYHIARKEIKKKAIIFLAT